MRLLALAAVASAVPQFPGYGYPQARATPFQQEYPQDEATARYLINFGAFQRVTGVFKTAVAAGTVVAHTVLGDIAFYQNPFTGVNSKYRVSIRDMAANTDFVLMLQTDCLKATTTGNVVSCSCHP